MSLVAIFFWEGGNIEQIKINVLNENIYVHFVSLVAVFFGGEGGNIEQIKINVLNENIYVHNFFSTKSDQQLVSPYKIKTGTETGNENDKDIK